MIFRKRQSKRLYTNAEAQVIAVLRWHAGSTGAELSDLTGLWSGSLYPALWSLERREEIIGEFAGTEWPRPRRYWLVEDDGDDCEVADVREAAE